MDADAYMQRIESIVDEHGVCVQFVGPGETEPPFAYTVGLYLVDHPEFVIVDLPLELSHALLNDLAFAVLRSSMRFSRGDRVHRLIGNGFVELIGVADPDAILGAAYEHRQRSQVGQDESEIPALQAVFADAAGLWPWDRDSTISSALLDRRSETSLGTDQYLPDERTRRKQRWYD